MLSLNLSQFTNYTTERLVLRQLVDEDAAQIFLLRSDDEVMRYIDKERAKTIADGNVFIDKLNANLASNEGITWAVALKEDPSLLIGTIGHWRIEHYHYRAEVGYMLLPSLWGKGYMKEALIKAIEIGFTDLQLHSIEGRINPANTASAALLLSTCFTKEAYFKENYFFNGEFKDTEIYSIINKAKP